MEWFLREVWPLLAHLNPALHVICGSKYQYHLERFRDRTTLNLDQPGIEVEDFVSDVRPAYRRASVVIAPLLASAGTNIKIMEAMAMGRAIISTSGGVHGLDVKDGTDVVIADSGHEMAAAIGDLFVNADKRRFLERQARTTAVNHYDWDAIATRQRELYLSLLKPKSR
jgi:glycosyltransferase involved in cell wall biosynthesis